MPGAPSFDLQSHSLRSDGSLEPAEVVARSAQAGIELLALTDHDSVAGVAEAVAAGRRAGVRVVPGVEISVVAPGHGDLHLLGYGVDIAHPGLLGHLEGSRHDRVRRAEAMAARLGALGWRLADDALESRRARGEAIGRPHLAAAVIDHPANRGRLGAEAIGNASSFLERYLIPGRPGFVPRGAPGLAEAIRWVHDAGGLAVWAHPFWDITEPGHVRRLIRAAAELGLDGVEAFYVGFSAAQVGAVVDACGELDLLTTGSSDFHGPEHPHFSRFGAFALHGHEPHLGAIARMG